MLSKLHGMVKDYLNQDFLRARKKLNFEFEKIESQKLFANLCHQSMQKACRGTLILINLISVWLVSYVH